MTGILDRDLAVVVDVQPLWHARKVSTWARTAASREYLVAAGARPARREGIDGRLRARTCAWRAMHERMEFPAAAAQKWSWSEFIQPR